MQHSSRIFLVFFLKRSPSGAEFGFFLWYNDLSIVAYRGRVTLEIIDDIPSVESSSLASSITTWLRWPWWCHINRGISSARKVKRVIAETVTGHMDIHIAHVKGFIHFYLSTKTSTTKNISSTSSSLFLSWYIIRIYPYCAPLPVVPFGCFHYEFYCSS